MSVEEQVLRLDIPMSYPLAMQVLDTSENLLEAALNLARRHAALLDCGIQVTTRTKFHHLTPVFVLVLNQVDSFNDIHMV